MAKNFPNILGGANPEQEEKQFDENGVPKELWGWRDRMQAWVDMNHDKLFMFLDTRSAKYKIICGTGFFHRPKDDVISLDVEEYKRAIEDGSVPEEAILFSAMHEFAHLKTMLEQDPAGKRAMLEQFNYEGKKAIRSENFEENEGKFVDVSSTYRQFYNILEDAIVNHMVKDTLVFAEGATKESTKKAEILREFYTHHLFPIYEKVPAGQGTHKKIKNGKKVSYVEATDGQGDLRVLKAEDYEAGFNWEDKEPPLEKAGQFLTFFMKNQMIGTKTADIKDENNSDGKFEMNADVVLALKGPIEEVYNNLIKRVLEKYKDSPEKLQRYISFMSTFQSVSQFAVKDNEIAETGKDVHYNVFRENLCVAGKEPNRELRLSAIKMFFSGKIKEAENILGEKISKKSYIEIFNLFKLKGKKTANSATIPLKFTQVERAKVMRDVLEPIYSLLCILDDSFNVVLPPEEETPPPPKKSDEPKKKEKPEDKQFEWQPGMKVRNKDKSSPNFGKKGVLTGVKEDGSVTVRYIKDDSAVAKMAKSAGENKFEDTPEERIRNPKENLILVQKGGDGGDGGAPVKYIDPPEMEQPKNEEPPEEGEDGEPSEEDEDGEPKDPTEGGGGPKEEQNDKDAKDEAEKTKEYLESLIQRDKEGLDKKKKEAQAKTPEGQKKAVKEAEKKEILAKAKEGGSGGSSESASITEEEVEKFQELEEKVRPHVEALAKVWADIVKNISQKISIAKDKYYTSGKIDHRKLQHLILAMEHGMEIEDKLLYERLVERIEMELKPKMLRIILAIDNSGSMRGNVEAVKTATLVINYSLESFRQLFRDTMKSVLGSDSKNLDIVWDSELWLFGNDENQRKIKDFMFTDLSFLDEEKAYPEIDRNQHIIDTILAFRKINASENTYDSGLWRELNEEHAGEELVDRFKKGQITEAIFQLSDGDISGSPQEDIRAIESIPGVSAFGLAIGGSEALESLKKRHGKNVISADTPEEIVAGFVAKIKDVIREQIERPMEEGLDAI